MATTTTAQHVPIDTLPGVCPPTDSTKAATRHYTAADKIRFVRGRPQKLGGWKKSIMNGSAIVGCARSIFSANLNEKIETAIGTSKRFYALIGSDLTNITPMQTTSPTAIANSLDTHYDTLANNPLSVTNGSNEIVVTDSEAALFVAGDLYDLSGATNTGGILAAEINKTHIVRAVGVGTITVKAGTNATSTTTGGGASVVRTSGLVTVNATAHGQINGDRVDIAAATAFGGILTGDINIEHTIRNVQTDSFDVMTEGTATSSVSGGGGASTTYQTQIAAGLCDETSGQGYGMNKYGNGLYGTALVSANGRRYPRIWVFRFLRRKYNYDPRQ